MSDIPSESLLWANMLTEKSDSKLRKRKDSKKNYSAVNASWLPIKRDSG